MSRFTDMCRMQDDDDLHHVFMPRVRSDVCHICLKPEGHPDHVRETYIERFHQLLVSAIDCAKQTSAGGHT